MAAQTVSGEAPKSFAKLNALRDIETSAQKRWEDEKAFEVDSSPEKVPKFMATFPFPYMNGRLHLGHSFSLSKVEFSVAYEKLKGKKALFPFGFHCTGMPIKACADKLKNEVELFGENFERFVPELVDMEESEAIPAKKDEKLNENVDPTKIAKKHGKANAKNTGLKYQFQIMLSMGVPKEEIHLFANPTHWLYYFPPKTIEDLKLLGLHVDWRRSFITTDANPYFDSFVRWQFNTLRNHAQPKIKFGERYTIYSPLDGQPCMDHDRASGEGVGVQEYTGIKLEVLLDELIAVPLESREKVKHVPVGAYLTSFDILAALKGKRLYMVAATLRPETMYGQTNCFVGVDLEYGIYQASATEAWICTERAAKNMSFQGLFGTRGEISKLGSLRGIDLVGVPLKAPLAQYQKVYTLPMEGVLATKGTGVVTSVPSDSPDDFITMQDLSKKSAYYNVQLKWVEPFMPPKPIIQTPNFGNLAAVAAVEQLNIKSQKDKIQLVSAKELVYKEGFYSGVLLVGQFKGKPVQEAKPLIKEHLIAEGLAFNYCEPEGQVISRSGDECVVTLADQWYMDYGESTWRKSAEACLAKMDTFGPETRNGFEKNLEWLGQWACSRSFGLGSRLPWDPQFLIESLSDSTIYMAYYTVAHILHANLDGSKVGSGNIKAEDMTDEVWNYIMLNGPKPKKTPIASQDLTKMKQEFEFFYPLDLRCSGKDLVTNHLTFFIYNHTAIFPEEKWPLAVRSNGHLLLNSEKMSKSTGNFMTLREAMERYGADATRFALADAGDGLDDANFLHKTADDAILKLFTEKEWVEEVVADLGSFRTGLFTWNDRVFEADITRIVAAADKAYSGMLYREALKYAYYDLQNAKGEYKKATVASNDPSLVGEKYEGMHRDLILRFIEVQSLVMAPIIPHWSEYLWSTCLKKPNSIQTALWPNHPVPVDHSILKAVQYIRDLIYRTRAAEDVAARKKAKKGAAPITPAETSKTLRLFYASVFPEWQDACLDALKSTWDEDKKVFSGKEREVLTQKKLISDKRVMPFVAMMKKSIESSGSAGFDRSLGFDELETLEANNDYIRRELVAMKIKAVEFVAKEKAVGDEDIKLAEASVPGVPTYRIF
ncbi:cytosolic leucyl tRNA synthetase [Physocladia obscura]|uniref:leucine--tRNA ligase n=1 Tax=Physocladia obscura TaxID=109957 RepID=A0AAD5T9F8_9FUNG|nr:cytosolic leucyl tRNA synthetase [Physocladia obscura]